MLTATIILYVLILVSFFFNHYQVAKNKRTDYMTYSSCVALLGAPCYFMAMRIVDLNVVFYGMVMVLALSVVTLPEETKVQLNPQKQKYEGGYKDDLTVILCVSMLLFWHYFTRTGRDTTQWIIVITFFISFVMILYIDLFYSLMRYILRAHFKFSRYLGRKIRNLPQLPPNISKWLFVAGSFGAVSIAVLIKIAPENGTILEKTQYLIVIPLGVWLSTQFYEMLRKSTSFMKAGLQLSMMMGAFAGIIAIATSITLDRQTEAITDWSSPLSILGSFRTYFIGVVIFSILWNLYCCMADAKIASLFNKIMATVTAGFVFFLNLIILAQPSTATFGMSSEAIASLATETGFSPSGLLALSVSAIFGSLVVVYALAALLLDIKLLWEQRTIQQ